MNSEILEEGVSQSKLSERKRIIQPIQRTQEAAVQRLLNFLQPKTYIRPHCHASAGASETLIILSGKLGFIEFTEAGEISQKTILQKGDLLDIEPGIWHTMVCLEEDTILAEFKKGPYSADEDKVFATWAPEEGTKKALEYLELLERFFL